MGLKINSGKNLFYFTLLFLFNAVGNAQTEIIINHHCTDISKIPSYWITEAKNTFRIGYTHTSHGSQLINGIEAIKGESDSLFYYEYSDWGFHSGIFLNDYWANDYSPDLGHNGDLT